MNNKKHPNLKPWQPGQSGNPAGRKIGSKNVSTIVRELKLEADAKDLDKQIKELRAELSDPDQELLSIEQFLNLAKRLVLR